MDARRADSPARRDSGRRGALPISAADGGALDALHREGIVHRDFKSGNVVLEGRSRGETHAVVTDFGLARGERTGRVGRHLDGGRRGDGLARLYGPRAGRGQRHHAGGGRLRARRRRLRDAHRPAAFSRRFANGDGAAATASGRAVVAIGRSGCARGLGSHGRAPACSASPPNARRPLVSVEARLTGRYDAPAVDAWLLARGAGRDRGSAAGVWYWTTAAVPSEAGSAGGGRQRARQAARIVTGSGLSRGGRRLPARHSNWIRGWALPWAELAYAYAAAANTQLSSPRPSRAARLARPLLQAIAPRRPIGTGVSARSGGCSRSTSTSGRRPRTTLRARACASIPRMRQVRYWLGRAPAGRRDEFADAERAKRVGRWT